MTGPSLPASFLGSMASADAALGERIARGWLSFCPGMALVGEAAERVDVIPLQLLAGLVELTVQAPDAQTRAVARLQRCQAQRQRLDAWGQQLLEAGLLWSAGALGSALRRLVDLAERAPDGLLVLKIAEWLTYLRGQELHGPALLDLSLILEASHGSDPDWLAIHAFALELCGCCPEAIAAAQAAIGARSLNPWADHALLHAWQRQGDLDRALDWAGQRRASWAEALPAMRLHNRWHAAVLSLEMGQPDRAIPALAEFRGETGTGPLLDAIALGWWLDLSAAPQETLWSALVPLVQERLCLPLIPFIACHYAWCLGRAGQQQDLETLLDHCRDQARVAGPEAGWCWRPAGLTLVEAIGAAACGRRATAWELLAPIRGWIDHAGGSDAQARVLHQTVRSLEPTRGGQDGLP